MVIDGMVGMLICARQTASSQFGKADYLFNYSKHSSKKKKIIIILRDWKMS